MPRGGGRHAWSVLRHGDGGPTDQALAPVERHRAATCCCEKTATWRGFTSRFPRRRHPALVRSRVRTRVRTYTYTCTKVPWQTIVRDSSARWGWLAILIMAKACIIARTSRTGLVNAVSCIAILTSTRRLSPHNRGRPREPARFTARFNGSFSYFVEISPVQRQHEYMSTWDIFLH